MNAPQRELYAWVCKAQRYIQDHRAAFPALLMTDFSRLEMSLNCLRVGLEIRITNSPASPQEVIKSPAGLPIDEPDLPC